MSYTPRAEGRNAVEDIIKESGIDHYLKTQGQIYEKESNYFSKNGSRASSRPERYFARSRASSKRSRSTLQRRRVASENTCYETDTTSDDEINSTVFHRPREVLRMPTPPPIFKRIVERAPTPPPYVIERVIIRPAPQQIVERIIERPRTPPPQIVHKEINESPKPPIVQTKVINVEGWNTLSAYPQPFYYTNSIYQTQSNPSLTSSFYQYPEPSTCSLESDFSEQSFDEETETVTQFSEYEYPESIERCLCCLTNQEILPPPPASMTKQLWINHQPQVPQYFGFQQFNGWQANGWGAPYIPMNRFPFIWQRPTNNQFQTYPV